MVLKRARSAITGRFIKIADAVKDPSVSIVETVKIAVKGSK